MSRAMSRRVERKQRSSDRAESNQWLCGVCPRNPQKNYSMHLHHVTSVVKYFIGSSFAGATRRSDHVRMKIETYRCFDLTEIDVSHRNGWRTFTKKTALTRPFIHCCEPSETHTHTNTHSLTRSLSQSVTHSRTQSPRLSVWQTQTAGGARRFWLK